MSAIYELLRKIKNEEGLARIPYNVTIASVESVNSIWVKNLYYVLSENNSTDINENIEDMQKLVSPLQSYINNILIHHVMDGKAVDFVVENNSDNIFNSMLNIVFQYGEDGSVFDEIIMGAPNISNVLEYICTKNRGLKVKQNDQIYIDSINELYQSLLSITNIDIVVSFLKQNRYTALVNYDKYALMMAFLYELLTMLTHGIDLLSFVDSESKKLVFYKMLQKILSSSPIKIETIVMNNTLLRIQTFSKSKSYCENNNLEKLYNVIKSDTSDTQSDISNNLKSYIFALYPVYQTENTIVSKQSKTTSKTNTLFIKNVDLQLKSGQSAIIYNTYDNAKKI